MKKCRCVALCLAALPLAAGAIQAAAQESDDRPVSTTATNSTDEGAVVLAPVLVQGQQLSGELPPGSQEISRSQLQSRSVNSWSDLGDRLDPGVTFNRRDKSIYVRGMGQDRVVTRIDGIRIPWLQDGPRGQQGGLDTVSFGSLSSIDLVKGSGAIRSGALTGFIDLHTLRPGDILSDDGEFGALLKTDYDSADRSRGAEAALAGSVGPGTRWLLQLGLRRGHELANYGGRGGYGSERVAPNPESFRQNNALLKLEHDLSEQHMLRLGAEHFRRTTTMDDKRGQGPDESFEIGHNDVKSRTDRDRIVLGHDYRARGANAMLDHGSTSIYWQRSRLQTEQEAWRKADERGSIVPGDPFMYGYPSGSYRRDNFVEESGFGITTEWGGLFAHGAVEHTWLLGGEWYGSRSRQLADGADNCSVAVTGLPAPFGPRACDFLHTGQADTPEVKGQAWSLWLEDELAWNDGRYALTPGLRFDAYHYRPQTTPAYSDNPNASVTPLPSSSGQRLSPSLRARYQADAGWSAYIQYAHGYRAPNATELYLNYGAPGTYLVVGNPRLKAETSRGWELGLEAGDSDLGARFSVFYNHYKNFIESQVAVAPGAPGWNPAWDGVYPMGVSAAVNRERVRIYGAELEGHWNLTSHWSTRASVAWAHGRDLNTGRYLNSIAPLKAQLAMAYNASSWGGELLWTVAARRNKVEYPEAENGIPADFKAPGYGVVDFNAWWSPAAVKGLRIQAGVYNLFDKKYWNALNIPLTGGRSAAPVASYTEPGRSVRISLTYQY